MISGLLAGVTLQGVGDRFGLSRERVRQIAAKQGIKMSELRRLQKEQAERHERLIARRVFGTSLTFPELEISELAEMWETDEETVRRGLEHRLAVHEVQGSVGTKGGKRVSDEDLLAALAEWGAEATSLTGDDYTAWAAERGIPGKQTIANRLGGWNTALVLAGLGEHVRDRGGLRPQVSDETLWATIYRYYREERNSYAVQAYDEYARSNDFASLATLRNRLGTWNEMKVRVRQLLPYAADRDGSWSWGDKVLDIVPGEEPRRVSSEAECLAALQRVAAVTTGPLTVQSYEAVRTDDDAAAVMIQRRCGSWVRALIEAGLEGRLSAKGRGKLERGEVDLSPPVEGSATR